MQSERPAPSNRVAATIQAAQAVAARSGGATGEVMVQANGVDLCAEAFGNPIDPALLIVQGACVSMIRWEVDFCQQLVLDFVTRWQ